MAENIAFSDWSEKLDTAGTNHWLPAYGLQQPTVIGSGSGGHRHLHHGQQNDHITFDSVDQADYYNGDDDDNNDDDLGEGDDDSWSSFNQSNYGGNIGRSTSYIFLETILEETSDDLRTDSERSSEEDFIKEDNWTAPNRDPFNLFNNKAVALAVYDNNDPGVHDDDDNVFFRSNFQDQQGWPTTVNAGGGSLLQFENLEKQCEQTVFRTTATSAPFMTNSAESLNGQRTTSAVSSRRHSWKHQQQNDDCDEYDEDETTLCSTPFSSYGAGDGSSVKSLSKSMESVHSAASKKRKRDSIVMDVTQSLEDLRRDDEQYDAVNSPVGTGMYKTVDCLIDPATFRKQNMVDATDGCKKAEELAAVGKQQRSSENLSEDSGFGDQVPRGPAVHQTYKPIAEDENYFEMSTKSILANAAAAAATEDCGDGRDVAALGPEKGTGGDNVDSLYDTKSKFSPAWRSYPDLGERSSVNPDSDTDDDHDHGSMASRLPMSSTPNLCSGDLDVTTGDYLRSKKFIDSTVSLNRSHSLKRIYYESESALSATSSRGSNLLMTTSFVNLAVPPSTNKGVHFCPVVSEVNWRESFSSTTDEVVSSAPETEEEENEAEDDNIDTMVMKLLTGLSSGTKQPSLAEKQQLRERLDFITGGSPPVSHRIGGGGAPTTTTGSTAAVAVDGGGNNNRSAQSRANDIDSSTVTMSKSKSIGGKLGGFFQRFSLRRLSGRRSKDKKKTKSDSETVSAAAPALSRPDTPPPPPPASSRQPVVGAVSKAATAVDRGKKPPLPPHAPVATAGDGFTTRRRLVYEENRGGRLPPPPPLPSAGSRASLQSRSPAAVMSRPDRRAGLLETDLDSNVTRTSSSSLTIGGGCSPNKKARSLLDLGASSGKLSLAPTDLSRQPVEASPSAEYRAKSMEFLLDKENQAAVQVPENELRKGTVNRGERMLSEHELRIQRSLQRLNLPEWYKTNHVPAQGFLLKRHSDAGHTTSMSSLSSTQSQSPKAHSNHNNSSLLSPQTHAATKNFSRWSTSRLNGGTHSNSTSPCSSTRSSFNYRQPYLGWRSQEKLSKPRTPAERLAAGLLAQQHHEQTSQANLSEVQSSIKEVTSAIANYVSSSSPDGSKERLNTDYHDTSSRCPSLRGSTGRLCWLESSFVGNKRPSLTRDTPPSENRTPPQPYKTTVPTKPTQKASGWVNVSDNAQQQRPGRSSEDLNCVAYEPGTIRCRNSECQRSATVAEARRTFKTCHNCNHMYCSRRCRRAHWQDHRKICLNRRTATLCQSVVDAVKGNEACLDRLSTIARRGFLSHGRGAVKCHFSGIELAGKFVRDGGNQQCEPVYAKWTEIDPELDRLEQLCKTYNPDTRFVLYVSVCVQSEVPGPGPVQWERHVVYKFVKLRLSKNLRTVNYGGDGPSRRNSAADISGPDTLILTSLPGRKRGVHKSRQVCFTNIQRHLRQRGVELRQHFPDVYQKLLEYVEGPNALSFTPVTVYPRDKHSGKTFMCIIMPDAEPEKLRLLPEDSSTVQTIDIGQEETEE